MMTDTSVLNDYIDKVYGYAVNKTYSRDEADELAQEILFTAVKELSKLRNPERFQAWLWGIADNVTKVFRRKMGRQRAMYSYDTLEYLEVTDEYTFEDEEIYENLREKISKLSKLYREIIIMYYYDSLSVKQISDKLRIPEGTVTWRLSEARNKIKKECMTMTESALRPEITEISLSISGNGNYDGKIPFPNTFIDDALSKSILYHCYKTPKSVEELAKLCGVPAYFIEDTVNRLIYREAVTESVKGKYQTCFIIYDEQHHRYHENSENLATPIADEFAEILNIFTQKVMDIGIYTAEKPVNELCYLFGILAFEHMNSKYNAYPTVPYKVKYDGNDWNYHAHVNGYSSYGGIGRQKSLNLGSDGTYAHYIYSFGGFPYRQMMYDIYINVCEKLLNGEELNSRDKGYAADMVMIGYLSNIDGKLHVNTPAFTFSQKAEFDRLAEECFTDFMPKYTAFVDSYISGYKNLFPKHVQDDVDRTVHNLWVALINDVVSAAQKKGLLDRPQSDSICDVIVQHKCK